MTILDNATEQLISQFGEDITVIKTVEDSPDDTSNPIYFSKDDSVKEEFGICARVHTNPDDDILKEYGFEQTADTVVYVAEDKIDNGDIIEFNGSEFVVNTTSEQQIGHGTYRYVHSVVRRE